MKKRLLALLLCLVMVIGLVPTVLANDPTTGEGEQTTLPTRQVVFYVDGDVPAGFNAQSYSFSVEFNDTTKNVSLAGYASNEPNTTFPGYTFAGWYVNSGVTGGGEAFRNIEVPYNATLPKGLYGTFTALDRTVKFEWVGVKEGDLPTGLATEPDVRTKSGAQIDLTPIMAPLGYQFDGWYYGNQKLGDTFTVPGVEESEIMLQGRWRKTFNVYYKKDANTPPDVSLTQAVANGDSVNAASCPTAWAASDKEFVHWVTADGNEVYKAGQSLGAITGDVTLIAVFKNKDTTTYNVSYYDYNNGNRVKTFNMDTTINIDPNGGVVTYTKQGSTAVELKTKTLVTVDADITLSSYYNYNYYYGYSFAGWKYTAATNTFTAQWTKDYPNYNTYSIYYYDYDDCKSEYANFPYGTSVVIDPNGGTAKLSGTSFSTKQSFNIYRDYTLTDASRSGYTFYGWDLTKSGSTYYFTAMWSRYKSDVPYMLNGTDHYAYIKGYPNGSFKPTDTITRAEAATIFYRLLTDATRKAYATTYNSFKDVPATAWYNTAVSTMAKLGIVNGGADGYFRPNDPITRAEIAAMIARCDGAYYTGTSTVFSDTYGHWAAGYIDRAYELGWINGYGTTYAPDRYISRAETVAVLNRVLNRAPQYTSDLTRNYTTFSDVATSAWYYLDVEEAANSHTYTRKSNADYETWTKLIADPSWF